MNSPRQVVLRWAVRATLLVGLLLVPAVAHAQWYVAGYLGVNHTQEADLDVRVPARHLDVRFDDVAFAAEPFDSPQYYGVRIGRLFGEARRFGVEVEFLHLKVIAKTNRTYPIQDRTGLLDLVADAPMSSLVERYSMTHGLNFVLVNAVMRQPLGSGRTAVVARLGAGPTVPHAESRVLGVNAEQYEYAGMGAHAAAGVDIALRGPLSAVAEYKLTWARPEITLAEGTGRTTTVTHQFAFGLAVGLTR
ncbi:MAG: hypothetical protein R2752_18295 [Vicinamibacterales bacterium]